MQPETEIGQRFFLGLGLVASALQGLLAAYAVMSLDDRNAARYRTTSMNLEALSERPLEDARIGAARGDRTPVMVFVELVHQTISAEHREWVALRTIAPDLSLDRLADIRMPKLH